VVGVDRLEHLVDLLEEIGAEARGRLLAVPRAAAWRAESRHQVHQAGERVGDARIGHRATVSAGPRAVNAALRHRGARSSFDPMARVQLYGTASCPFCVRAKRLLEARSIPYDEIDVGGDPEARAHLVRR